MSSASTAFIVGIWAPDGYWRVGVQRWHHAVTMYGPPTFGLEGVVLEHSPLNMAGTAVMMPMGSAVAWPPAAGSVKGGQPAQPPAYSLPALDFVSDLARFIRERPARAVSRAVLADLTANHRLATNVLTVAGRLVRGYLAPPRPDALAQTQVGLTLTLTEDYAIDATVAAWAVDVWLAATKEATWVT